MLSNEIIEKLRQNQELTLEEIKYVLDYIREYAKKRVGINESNEQLYLKKPDDINISDYTKCFESCMYMGAFCDKFNIGF